MAGTPAFGYRSIQPLVTVVLGGQSKVVGGHSRSQYIPQTELQVVLLVLFGQLERTYTLERAAHTRAVATA